MSGFLAEWERPDFDSVPSLAENAVWRIPGCDDTVLRKLLQESYRDFCRRSAAMRTWRRVEAEPHVKVFPVVPVLSGEIDCVTRVLYGHSRREVRGWRVTGDPPMLELSYECRHHIIDDTPGVMWVQDRPNVGALPVVVENGDRHIVRLNLLVEAVEIPHIGEERAPRAFLRRYGDAIIDGALARMMGMSGRSWSDPEQSQQHAIAYENAVSEARHRSLRGGPGANPRSGFAVDMSGAV